MHVVVYQSKNGEWRWRLVSRNHKIVADSAEGYESKANVQRALVQIIKGLRNAITSDNLSVTVKEQTDGAGNLKNNLKASKNQVKKTTKSSK